MLPRVKSIVAHSNADHSNGKTTLFTQEEVIPVVCFRASLSSERLNRGNAGTIFFGGANFEVDQAVSLLSVRLSLSVSFCGYVS